MRTVLLALLCVVAISSASNFGSVHGVFPHADQFSNGAVFLVTMEGQVGVDDYYFVKGHIGLGEYRSGPHWAMHGLTPPYQSGCSYYMVCYAYEDGLLVSQQAIYTIVFPDAITEVVWDEIRINNGDDSPGGSETQLGYDGSSLVPVTWAGLKRLF